MAKFAFIIQGEGRGHITQAVALQKILEQAQHEVCLILVGKSPQREVPLSFFGNSKAPLFLFDSPHFVTDKHKKGIKIWDTILKNIWLTPKYLRNLAFVKEKIKEAKPDVIVNFYDFLGGLYSAFYNEKTPIVCIGHQYLLQSSKFEFPKGHHIDRFLLKTNTWITSLRAKKRLALSFTKYLDDFKNTVIVPPLIRKEVFEFQPEKQDFYLVYINNDGYADEIRKWHYKNPHIRLECFWDRKDAPQMEKETPNLTFHKISDTLFLEKMRTCKALATTAGFESVCEALYLSKPVLAVPIQNHYEQSCNALDAQKAGAGIRSSTFDLSLLLDYVQKNPTDNPNAKSWIQQAPQIFLKELESLIPTQKHVETTTV